MHARAELSLQKYNQGVLLIILLGLFQILLAKGNSVAHKTMKFRDEDGFRYGLVQGSHDYFPVLVFSLLPSSNFVSICFFSPIGYLDPLSLNSLIFQVKMLKMHFSWDDGDNSMTPLCTVLSKVPGYSKCSEILAVAVTDTRRAMRGRPGQEARSDSSAIPGPRQCTWHLGG